MLNMKLVQNWIPFAFCAFLVYQYVTGAVIPGNWQYFSIWLTMCFFFVGIVTHSMQKQILALQWQIQQLQHPEEK
ncbi:hypothetical protein [Massilia sp. PWRC2]|uniref:hypothetical protein n=1 Tax=Massilia sp. PWRC2 TaxID=2804626 RepID=UPI003CE9318B